MQLDPELELGAGSVGAVEAGVKRGAGNMQQERAGFGAGAGASAGAGAGAGAGATKGA